MCSNAMYMIIIVYYSLFNTKQYTSMLYYILPTFSSKHLKFITISILFLQITNVRMMEHLECHDQVLQAFI